ncbi:Zds1p [Nakaseomyces bracarensis]|uniref:Zds1p n=1 Tax=Nakaseomyces bracarensis TaxID=273131 RepID=UPI003871F952
MKKDNNRGKEDMEKRKSEVLIAAQSLDNELRSVKNLKRLSIGSIDLLTDPDMEIHIPYGESYRNSWSANEASMKRPLKPTRYSDPTPYKPKTLIRRGPEDTELDNSEITTTDKSVTNTGKTLSRRGAVNSRRTLGAQRKLNKNDDSSEITQNLLWVRADQHPNVKPENYIELVQDALHNMNMNGNEADNQDKENIKNTYDNHELTSYNKRSNNLSRRPSLLRRSYTEFDYESNDETKSNNERNPQQQLIIPTLTLKDITEELTRISNKAGLTNDDAITLARTLSMASSYDKNEETNTQDHDISENGQAKSKEEENFASTMVLQNSTIVKSEHNSLKRSKFTTYRIQNSQEDFRNEISSQNEAISTLPIDDDVTGSPSSINDIYDHYRESSGDWSNLIHEENLEERPVKQTLGIEIKNTEETPLASQDIENGTNTETEDQPQSRKREQSHRRKRNGWFWSNKEGEQLNINTKENSSVTEESTETKEKSTNSFNAAFMQFNKKSNVRHDLIIKKDLTNTTHVPVNSSEIEEDKENHDEVPEKEKRHRIDKKITNLFRRKAHHQRTTAQDVQLRGKELKVRVSNENLSKFTVTTKKKDECLRTNTNALPHAPLQPAVQLNTSSSEGGLTAEVSKDESRGLIIDSREKDVLTTVGENQELETTPALQPAVSVTSTKSSVVVAPLPASSSSSTKTPHLPSSSSSSSSASSSSAANKVTSPLPPRKLTFADVKRKDRANAPIEFTDSAFGFPLPELTCSTVVMFDHRLPINVERAIYRLSHLKLSNSKRALREQVLLSNFMYSYLNLVNHTLYMEQSKE